MIEDTLTVVSVMEKSEITLENEQSEVSFALTIWTCIAISWIDICRHRITSKPYAMNQCTHVMGVYRPGLRYT